jgi:hypothetical protein
MGGKVFLLGYHLLSSSNVTATSPFAISGKRADSEIIAEISLLSDHSDSEHSEEETEEEFTSPSTSDAISALAVLKGYLCTRQMSKADEWCLSRIQCLLYRLV